MILTPATTPSLEAPAGIDFAPLPLRPSAWRRLVLPLISFAVLVAALRALMHVDLREVIRLVPARPAFWALFALSYLAGPLADWVIFRRLWGLPPSGLHVLVRKTISNEILLGYSGELYLYGWARRHVGMVGAPFGAIKDVAILSAAVGNGVTLLLLACTWPMLATLHVGLGGELLAGSIATVAASSLATLAFRRKLFSLAPGQLRFVAAIHLVRIVATTGLCAALWYYLMPAAPLRWWLMLATIRLLISRLPFMPNKDLAFAAAAALLIGQRAEVTDLLALVAALVLGTHIVLGSTFAIGDMIGVGRPADERGDAAAR